MFSGQPARTSAPRPVSRRAAALATFTGSGLTVTITIVQTFVLVPLALSTIGPELYAGWLAASELLIWLQLLDAGLPNLLVQRAGARAGQGDWTGAARWASTTLAAVGTIAVGLLGLAILLAPSAAAWLSIAAADRGVFVDAFRLGSLGAALLMLANVGVALSRGVQRTTMISATQVLGAAAGLVLSVALLLTGWGLWGLAVGLLVRGVIAVAGAAVFVASLPRAGASWWRSPSRQVARELAALTPFTSVASVGYVLANNSEVLLVTSLLGPLPALAYALTRRAFDGVRTILDTIVWAVSGGFAHLVTAADRHRARQVLSEIVWGRLALAAMVLSVVVAVNEPFVLLLFGPSAFAGPGLTIAFAIHIMLGGQSFLANYLWRSAGRVREGSLALGVEAVLRVTAMALGLVAAGPIGAPMAAAVVSAVVLVWAHRGLDDVLPPGEVAPSARLRWAPPALLAVAAAVAMMPLPVSWLSVVVTAGSVAAAGGLVVWLALPADLRNGRLQRVRLS